jgi:hypothetical protein
MMQPSEGQFIGTHAGAGPVFSLSMDLRLGTPTSVGSNVKMPGPCRLKSAFRPASS